jgi:hypothetical protein
MFYLNHSPIHIFFLKIPVPLIFDADKPKRQSVACISIYLVVYIFDILRFKDLFKMMRWNS